MVRKLRPRAQAELVDWIDTCSSHSWQTHEEAMSRRVTVVESVGFLVVEEKDSITIAESQTRDPDSSPWGCTTTIPKTAIIRRKKIK